MRSVCRLLLLTTHSQRYVAAAAAAAAAAIVVLTQLPGKNTARKQQYSSNSRLERERVTF